METYTHLRPRSLQFEQDGCLPAFDMGRSLRSHLTLWTKGREHGRTGREGGRTKRTIGRNESGRTIRSDGMDPNGEEEGGNGRSPPHSASPAGRELFAGRLWVGVLLGTTRGGRGGAL